MNSKEQLQLENLNQKGKTYLKVLVPLSLIFAIITLYSVKPILAGLPNWIFFIGIAFMLLVLLATVLINWKQIPLLRFLLLATWAGILCLCGVLFAKGKFSILLFINLAGALTQIGLLDSIAVRTLFSSKEENLTLETSKK